MPLSRHAYFSIAASCAVVVAAACGSSDDDGANGGAGGAAGAGGGAPDAQADAPEACPEPDDAFEAGDEVGHPDPYGARAAGQARAGRLTSESMIVQPAHGRQRVNVGDYVLANDKIAVVIEDKGLSDGYARWGGEVLAVDRVGDDGRPMGLSNYVETLMGLSIEMINVDAVSVINDGSDGNAAVVRASGRLERIPFLDGALSALFPQRYGVMAAYDFVLEPGAESVLIRVGLKNPNEEPLEVRVGNVKYEMHGFFHTNKSQLVSASRGFAKVSGEVPWAGFVSGEWNFAWRSARGEPLEFGAEISGFNYFIGPGFAADGCKTTWVDHVEIIGGGPGYDGLREAIRRVDGDDPWREVAGVVEDSTGAPVADAWVHLLDATDAYTSRTQTDSSGAFTIHAPSEEVKLVAQKVGYPLGSETPVAADASTATLAFGPTGTIAVTATALADGAALPVRVQVIPTSGFESWPASFGVRDEKDGRLHQEFAVTGSASLVVAPGEHRVIVSRGYEWELSDTTVTVGAGETVAVDAMLEHSVDTTGVMCADFHIHSSNSADSTDPIPFKVKSAVADGLDIPVSSEHEWVVDFGPVVKDLGLEQWAFGMASEELTTFAWGHFGVVPLQPRPDAVNNGAVEWIGLEPPAMFDNVQALPEDPVLIINHPSRGGFGAYFSAAGLDHKTGTASRDNLWSTNFDAIEVFNDASLDEDRDGSVRDWFSLLNAGHTFWAVGSSDSHQVRSEPIGYPRTCMTFGHDDPTRLTPEAVRDAVGSGRTTISGGLYIAVVGPGGEGPGETITGASTTADFVVTVQAPSWVDATELEVIVNGATQDTMPLAPMGAGTAKRFVNAVTVTLDSSASRNWVVFHARGGSDLAPLHPERLPFAVSNPVFFD